jgi:hydrogenase maturation protease
MLKEGSSARWEGALNPLQDKSAKMKTLVLGLGNYILRDDSVGLLVASELKQILQRPDITIQESELGGINLLELLDGYDRAIIVDAIQTGRQKAGHMFELTPESLVGSLNTSSTHGIDFRTLIELGRRYGMHLPEQIVILAVEVEDVNTFDESCNDSVLHSVPDCMERVVQLIG